MKKKFNKELVMTKEDDEDFKNSIKCWICGKYYIDTDVDDTDGKYRGSAHGDGNIYLKLNHTIPIVFRNLKIMIPILLCKNQANSILK